jgi:hypothetical protein
LTILLSCPLIFIIPSFVRLFAINRPERWFKKVVFPAPDAPIMLMNDPGLAEPEILSRITLVGPGFFLPKNPFWGSDLIEIFSHESKIYVSITGKSLSSTI